MTTPTIKQIAAYEVAKHAAEPNAHGTNGPVIGANHGHSGGSDGAQIQHGELLGSDDGDYHTGYAKTDSGDRVLTAVESPRDGDALVYEGGVWVAKNGYLKATGIPSDQNGDYLTTLAYNVTTRTLTIAPISPATTFDIFVQGERFTFAGPQTITHAATTGGHFFYYELDGVLTYSTTPWSLIHDAPVSYVYYDATNTLALPFDERHHAGRDVWWHQNQHRNEGTKASTGFALTGYTLSSGATDAAVSWALSSGRVEDEDITVDTEAVPDGGPYLLMARVGTGAWQINASNTLPFYHSGGALLYNSFIAGTWGGTAVTEDYFVNYYVFALTTMPAASITPALGSTANIVIVPGQAIYSTEALAHAESVSNLAWGDMPFQEIAPLYQITFRYNAVVPLAYANTAKCAITRAVRIVGNMAVLTSSAQTDHGSLSGLSDDDHAQYALTTGATRATFYAPVESATPDTPGTAELGTDHLFFYNATTDRFESRGYFNYADFAVQATDPAYKAGRLWYSDGRKALSYYPDEFSTSSNQIGYEIWKRVRNDTGATITEGTVVKISGATGQTSKVVTARADVDSAAEVIGVMTTTASNNGYGLCTMFGQISNIDTSAWAEGTVLYLSATTAGLLTSTAPSAPNHTVAVATVAHSHATQGIIDVHPSEPVINDNHVSVDTAAFTGNLAGIDPDLASALAALDSAPIVVGTHWEPVCYNGEILFDDNGDCLMVEVL